MQVRILLASALLTVSVLPAGAQAVKVSFHGGKVDLSAENATVRAILNEWARVGGTRILNAERLAGPPITVEFKDAYEQPVIEALLRGVAGYIVGPRPVAGSANASGFDRIVILATSSAPRPAAVTPAVARPPGPQPLRRLPTPIEDEPDDADDDKDAAVVRVPTAARPETPADLRRRLGELVEAEPNDDEDAEPAPPTATPGNPFGVTTGAARPGMITPAPAARPAQGRPAPEAGTQP